MPFKEHSEFEPPQNSNAKIWRYMDFTKFISTLEKSALYFSRLDKLSKFDPFEGYYTHEDIRTEDTPFDQLLPSLKKEIKTEEVYRILQNSYKADRDSVKKNRATTFVNSWHVQEYESAAMWKLYLKSDEGVAIQSTYRLLTESFQNYKEYEIHIGLINYIDYERDGVPKGNILSPFMYKRKSFEHEKELRALIWTPQHGRNDMINPEHNIYKNVSGLNVPVDLDVLIEKIHLAPSAPDWILELVKAVTKRYGLVKEVVRSSLDATPLY